jgi:hypothetical protein
MLRRLAALSSALILGSIAVAGPVQGTVAPPPESTEAPSTVPLQPAARGTAIQETPTLPPPTTVAPFPPVEMFAPAGSGSGRRVVYSKGLMRVWVVDGNENVIRSYLVSGRLNQPNPGTYRVFSRSAYTCNIDHPDTCMRWMVRFTRGPSGDNIGFHEIPRTNGRPLQSDSQLGQALSSGCVRQSTADAQFMWGFAAIGTVVVVI